MLHVAARRRTGRRPALQAALALAGSIAADSRLAAMILIRIGVLSHKARVLTRSIAIHLTVRNHPITRSVSAARQALPGGGSCGGGLRYAATPLRCSVRACATDITPTGRRLPRCSSGGSWYLTSTFLPIADRFLLHGSKRVSLSGRGRYL